MKSEALSEPLEPPMCDAAERAIGYVSKVAAHPELEVQVQRAAGALYHATSAVVMASEGDRLNRESGDSKRLSMAELVLERRLSAQDPLACRDGSIDKTLLSLLTLDVLTSGL